MQFFILKVKHFPIPRCNISTFYIKNNQKTNAFADLGGTPGTHPPWSPNSFIFMQFSAKNLQNNPNLGVGAPPGENSGSATVIYQKTMYQQWRIQDFRGQQPLGLGRKPII